MIFASNRRPWRVERALNHQFGRAIRSSHSAATLVTTITLPISPASFLASFTGFRAAEVDLAEFIRRFAGCEVLKQAKSVLCLGARLGTEVKALHQLGYFAVGVDLNPGADNSFVLPGDFHHLVFADESIDAVYTNALDHAFDLSRVIGERGRVLRPGGLVIIDLLRGYEEGFVPGEFEAFHWARADGLIDRIIAIGRFEQLSARNLGYHRRDEWLQRVLRKSTTSPTLQLALR